MVRCSLPVPRSSARPDEETRGDVLLEPETRVRKPPLYRVLMLNDDFTPMEFVVMVLMRFFGKDAPTATRIMLRVHHEGKALVGVYARQVAEARVAKVNGFARESGHPLKCIFEKEDGDADGEF